eukprot:CAMPEP_0114613128 /NCGR_PEP_ID=MMETSP0168-20121206/4972_1 /TAXON_ID=95228 ORGANISM="Vannella sp., Strain DIVA3 517/6/12" /NCGR_SAMPLE_ID=MMETSP0168 /ASSEMBLY_ACC=CAM_ASM_000044 /LENGTH=132 /DNA_ID=CAMNT_0001824123 /DNA_START=17 /DNA_END=415 /DNA_ORIENTATION=+
MKTFVLLLALVGVALAATHSLSVTGGSVTESRERSATTFNIYDFVDVSFEGFEKDETVTVQIADEHGHSLVLEGLPAADGFAHLPVARIIPTDAAVITVTGEQSGVVGSYTGITVAVPNMEFQREVQAKWNN